MLAKVQRPSALCLSVSHSAPFSLSHRSRLSDLAKKVATPLALTASDIYLSKGSSFPGRPRCRYPLSQEGRKGIRTDLISGIKKNGDRNCSGDYFRRARLTTGSERGRTSEERGSRDEAITSKHISSFCFRFLVFCP